MPRPFKRKRSKYDEIRDERRKVRNERAREGAKRRRLEEQNLKQEFEPAEFKDDEFAGGLDSAFYGFLTEEEQAYYSNVNSKIIANDFDDQEERQNFITAVHRESKGKELKLASSQSCSRFLERLIIVSTPGQIRDLFAALLEGVANLSQHRFGSHVLETLFIESAKHIEVREKKKGSKDQDSLELEDLILKTSKELEPQVGFLLTDPFGSHVLRSLLLVFSGQPLQTPDAIKMLASKKKEKNDVVDSEKSHLNQVRKVPESFAHSIASLTSAAVSNLHSTYLRSLATHPTGNPVLQLLLRLELDRSDKGRNLGEGSLFHKLFSPSDLAEESEGAKLASGLMYDSTGSHLIEIVVQFAPGKTFKKLYKTIWAPKMMNMAKNEVASYVLIKILHRIGKDDLANARDILCQEMKMLLDRRRFSLLQNLIEKCIAREVTLEPVAGALRENSGKDQGDLLQRILYAKDSADEPNAAQDPGDDHEYVRGDTHGSLLGQALLQAPVVSTLIQNSILATEPLTIVTMAKDNVTSRLWSRHSGMEPADYTF
jgi:nucleolar protein 9